MASTALPDFERKPTFEGFLVIDQESSSSESDDNATTNNSTGQTKLPKSRSKHTFRPTVRVREAKNFRQKRQKTLSTSNLIVQLSQLLDTNWEDLASTNVLTTNLISSKNNPTSAERDLFKLLATKLILEANAQDQG